MIMSLKITNLNYGYRKNEEVIKNLSLYIGSGEHVALMGSSGSGKSTLLKLIMSYLKPNSGNIYINDHPVVYNNPLNNIAYVSQSSVKTLFPWLRVIDNIKYPLKLRKQLTKDNIIYCDYLIEKFNLSHKTRSFPLMLSGGEQKRLSLAIALSYKPELVLLDEPFSGVDFSLTEELWSLLYEYFKTNRTTVFFATHNINEAAVMADRVVFLNYNKCITESKVMLKEYEDSEDANRSDLLLKGNILPYKSAIISEYKNSIIKPHE